MKGAGTWGQAVLNRCPPRGGRTHPGHRKELWRVPGEREDQVETADPTGWQPSRAGGGGRGAGRSRYTDGEPTCRGVGSRCQAGERRGEGRCQGILLSLLVEKQQTLSRRRGPRI